jgi:hypothetical protein
VRGRCLTCCEDMIRGKVYTKNYTTDGYAQVEQPLPFVSCAGILEQSMGPRNREGIGLWYRPAKLHRLAESIPGLLNV